MATSYPKSELLTEDMIAEFEASRDNKVVPKAPEINKDNFIIPETTEHLPFERIDEDTFDKLFNKYNLEANFDDIDVREHMNERAHEFKNLTQDEQTTIEKAIVQYANDNEGEVLFAMRLTGRETDLSLADELEDKYGVNADRIRIATEMFRATYAMWEMNNITVSFGYGDSPTQELSREMKEHLITLEEAADYLEHFQVTATHGTTPYAAPIIETGEILLKSDTGEMTHFEGDGVYAGVLGSDKNYQGREDVFEFYAPFADTLPIIASYNYPKARICILGEGLDIQKRDHIIATAAGLQQWRQLKHRHEPVSDWKLDLLEETLGVVPQVYIDSEGVETVVADTDKEPIHWAMACRALRIPRFIPKNELSKSDIIYHE